MSRETAVRDAFVAAAGGALRVENIALVPQSAGTRLESGRSASSSPNAIRVATRAGASDLVRGALRRRGLFHAERLGIPGSTRMAAAEQSSGAEERTMAEATGLTAGALIGMAAAMVQMLHFMQP